MRPLYLIRCLYNRLQSTTHPTLSIMKSYILFSLLLLTSFILSKVSANDTIAVCTRPIQGRVYCCPLGCGLCGGKNCENFPLGANNCCRDRILAKDRFCWRFPPPCMIQTEGVCTPTNPQTKIKICCPDTCGQCGGPGCSARPGGGDKCCTNIIKANGRKCNKVGPPCVA